MVSNFSVTTACLRTIVLAESGLLGRVVIRVVADNVTNQQGVRQTVRNVELRAQFVRHGVTYTEEGVGKRDTGDSRCTVNTFTRNRVFRPFVVRRRQVFFQQFQGLQSLTVRELRSQYGNVSFQGVSYRIQTTERTQGLRHIHHQVGVDNRHIRGQGIVSQRIFLTGCIVGHNRKRCDFRTGTGSGGDGDHFRFHAHFRELVDTFTDVHKAQRQFFEVSFRMFVHDPHDFRGVHRGTTAQRDDYVRFEGVRQLSAFAHNAQSRVGFNFEEDFGFNASRFQHRGDLVCIAVVEQEAVSHDERTFVAISNHFIQRDGQRATAEVDRFRKFVPQHVFSSLSNGFLVDQVFRTNVFRDGVTTPGTTTQRQGRCEFEVVQVADTTLRGRGVDQDTRGFHHLTEVSNAFWLVILVSVQAGGVTDTAHSDQFFCFFYRFFEIFRTVHRQSRRQFFVCERFAFVNDRNFTDQNLGGFWYGEACQFSNFVGWLTDDSGVQSAIFQDNVLNRFQLLALQHVAAVAGETFANGIIDGINNDNRLFRSTDYAVIEGFRHQNRRHSAFDIRGFINDNRGVACAYADSRFTGAVCCFNHAWTTCRKDQVNIRVVHQRIRQFYGRLIDPANQIFRRAGSDSRLQNDVCRFVGCFFSARMRRKDDGVTGLQANQ
nr:hypothetical protein [Salmonella enterica]